METIKVVMDLGLLRAADTGARKLKVNRSALVREALREHLKRLHTREYMPPVEAHAPMAMTHFGSAI